MNPAYVDRGLLQLTVTAGSGVSPVAGARVRLTDPADGRVLEELVTDSSGQTPAVELPAPPLEFSVAGGGERP